MAFNLAQHKRKARQILHGIMAVPAFYSDRDTLPTPITVRWHNKLVSNGASIEGFDASIIEGINRLVFQEAELEAAGIALRRGGRVVIPDYDNATFKLDSDAPQDGPENIYWNVVFVEDDGPQPFGPDPLAAEDDIALLTAEDGTTQLTGES